MCVLILVPSYLLVNNSSEAKDPSKQEANTTSIENAKEKNSLKLEDVNLEGTSKQNSVAPSKEKSLKERPSTPKVGRPELKDVPGYKDEAKRK